MTYDIAEQRKTAEEIASKYPMLSEKNTERFANFIIEWSKLENQDWTRDRSYLSEWAKRFMNGEEYLLSAGTAMQALINVDGLDNAIYRLARQLKSYNGKTVEYHLAEAKDRIKRSCPDLMKGYHTPARAPARMSIAKSAPKNDCICQSAKRMIGKIPNCEKNLKKLVKF